MIDLDALEALEKLATPGPWVVYISGTRGSFHVPQIQVAEARAADTDGADGATVSHPNRDLIQAAHNALPELIRLARIGQKVEEGK